MGGWDRYGRSALLRSTGGCGFLGTVEQLQDFQPLLLFHYTGLGDVINHGPTWSHWAVLGGVELLYGAVAWWRFDQKELGV